MVRLLPEIRRSRWLAGWPVSCLAGWPVSCLAGWPVSCLALLLVGCGVNVSSSGDDDDEATPTADPGTTSPTPTETPTGPSFEIKVEPTSLNFGMVVQGEQETQAVAFFNEGLETLHLQRVDVSAPMPFFAVDSLSTDLLLPSESIVVDVTFMPAQTGKYTGALTLITQEGNAPTVKMTGTGVSPTSTRQGE